MNGFYDLSPMLKSGVYLLMRQGVVVYVGKSKELYTRIYTHRTNYKALRKGKVLPPWMRVRAINFDQVMVRPCAVGELDALEVEMINHYKPKFNILYKTDEKITTPTPLMVNGIALMLNGTVEAVKVTVERRI